MPERIVRLRKGDGVHMIPWPKRNGSKPSKAHCPGCANCTDERCYNGSRDHRFCNRHYIEG